MFHHFGSKLPIQGQIVGVLGENRDQISVFHFMTPKVHIPVQLRVFWAIARQNPSRGLFSTLVREKKINKKVTQKLYFTHLPRSPPWTDFYQIWNKRPLVDIINPDKLVSICPRVSILQGFKVSIFPIGNWRRRYNSAALPRSLWNWSDIWILTFANS